MAITNPLLPPKAGYVEVVDENGNHVYKPTRETQERLELEAVYQQKIDELQTMIDTLSTTMNVSIETKKGATT